MTSAMRPPARRDRRHSRRVLLLCLLCASLPNLLTANPANGDPRLERLFSSFIAPCCWRETLLSHLSPKADELREAIRQEVAAGRTDAEIQQRLIAEYTSRILSTPEGASGEWLRWTPIAALTAGVAAVAMYVKRSLAPRPARTGAALAPLPPDLEDF